MSEKLIIGVKGGRYVGRRRPSRTGDDVDASEIDSINLADVFDITADGAVDASDATSFKIPSTGAEDNSAATRVFVSACTGGGTPGDSVVADRDVDI